MNTLAAKPERDVSYLLMILEPRGQRAERTQDEGAAAYRTMLDWGDSLKARGLLIASESLRADDAAVRVRKQAGKTSFVDGPFAEAKEMIGGFFLIGTTSREEALAIAAECPAAAYATVEVREVAPCSA